MGFLAWYRPALLTSLRAGYGRGDLAQDVLAGLLVGVVALPLSMGLAIASGVEPEQGLYTAIVGGLIVGLLGGSRMQIAGPAGAFVGLCAVGVTQHGYGGLALATLLAGVLMLGMALLRLGRAIAFIPIPVVIGFTTGIALIIASTQLGPALGIADPERPLEHVHESAGWLWTHRAQAAWAPAALAGATIALIALLRRLSPKLPGAMLALVALALAAWAADLPVETVGSRFGGIPHGLPTPSLPDLGLGGWTPTHLIERVQEVSGLALAIALLASIESLLSAVVADGMSGERHDPNAELVGQGVANLVSPLFAGLPVTGVIARTSTNVRAGARSPVSAIVHALTVLLIMVALAPLVDHVPLACLAGVLLVVCWHMAELRHWPHILRAGRGDAFLLPLAFLLTITVGLTWAVVLGVLLAMLFFVKRMSDAVRVERAAAGTPELAGVAVPPGVEVYEVHGPFFFGAATLIRDLDWELRHRPRAMVLRLRDVPFIDATAGFALKELATSCRRRGVRLLLCEVAAQPAADLERLGVGAALGDGAVQPTLAAALAVGAAEPAAVT